MIEDAEGVALSVVTPWELGFMQALGRLELPPEWVSALLNQGFRILDVQLRHVRDAVELPLHHRDPFDRMLIGQARTESMTLVSTDEVIRLYDVPVLDAAT